MFYSYIHKQFQFKMKKYLQKSIKYLILFLLGFTLIQLMNYSIRVVNSEVMLKQHYNRTLEERKTNYQNMYRTVLEKYNIIKNADSGFANIMLIQMSNQSPNKELMWYWVQQNNPSITYNRVLDMYSDLTSMIESKRDYFTNVENKLQGLKFLHDSLLLTIPSKFVVGRRKPIIYIPILSNKTDTVFNNNRE